MVLSSWEYGVRGTPTRIDVCVTCLSAQDTGEQGADEDLPCFLPIAWQPGLVSLASLALVHTWYPHSSKM